MRIMIYTTNGWYDLAPITPWAESYEWEQNCTLLAAHTAAVSGTYWTQH